ncbi:MAG: NADH-quinone oxidoreductase subunit L [Pseudohongiellaceae bacterium]|jgi:NADH-quinone oxidoreductase subunit L
MDGFLNSSGHLWVGLGLFLVPFLAALILIFFGRKLPRGGDWIAQTAIVTCAAAAVFQFIAVIVNHGDPQWSWSSADHGWSLEWLSFGDFHLSVGIFWDNLSVIMAAMVTVVGSCIFFFSAGYMHGDRDYPRFFAYLSYFCFAMLGLVVVDNLLFLFIFWELVGVGSYLLIGFYYDQPEPPLASMKAFLVNRIGDVLFLLGLILAWQLFGTLNYHELFETLAAGNFPPASERAFSSLSNHSILTLSGILIFCGAISKSAQVPLHTWLPDAMAGPTPVSALIHAATMVAAGVFMVGRMYPYFTPEALQFIAGIGALTALVGATMGLVMWDIKKVLAYSTMSQLGYMMLGLGVGGYVAGLFHLITHAFFKACLFLGSGSVIHAVHSQDMRDMGGLRKKMPVTFWTFMIATLALCGVPAFAGYYSKDQIIANAMAWWTLDIASARFVPILFGAVGAFMTTFYMFRLIFLTFFGQPQDQERYDHAHESPALMAVPLIILAGFGLLGGGTMNPLPVVDELWFNSVIEHPESAAAAGLHLDVHHELEHMAHALHDVHYWAMGVSVFAILAGFVLARRMYLTRATDPAEVSAKFGPMHRIISNKYYFDDAYNKGIVGNLKRWNQLCYWWDRTIVDGIVNGMGLVTRFLAFLSALFDTYVIDGAVNFWRWLVRFLSGCLRLWQSGNATNYLTWTVLGVLALVAALARGN